MCFRLNKLEIVFSREYWINGNGTRFDEVWLYLEILILKFHNSIEMSRKALINEVKYKTSRSSGKGGQHVNKVETRVELHFDVEKSYVLNEDEKAIIREKLSNRISNAGILQVVSQAKRSQLLNRENATDKFIHLIEQALIPQKERIPTKPSKGMVRKRLKAKKQQSEKKAMRQKVNFVNRD